MKYFKIETIIVALIFFSTNIIAQNFSTQAEILSSGGGESTGNNFTNFGVIGESFVAYPVTGSNYESSIGFLYISAGIPVLSPEIYNHNNIKIYPNPSVGVLKIEEKDLSVKKIGIYNTFGVKVYECEFSNSINISRLKNGLYFLRLLDANNRIIHMEKLIKN